ncbi:hypothetical protein LEP1GSC056_1915 [Leptospira borgpetersenii str. Brem 328]|uniref:Uncharacterized protein n=1 Tax=Leptospira borgpetersenii str. Brem 328 TaxID=1049780 RepID=A0ABC9SNC2_LEPBO|nr:hypothetical protein LEP1GSC056_1915 [Leptospira borgpetersenii str. Brem 328]
MEICNAILIRWDKTITRKRCRKSNGDFFHLFQNKKVKTDFSSYRQSRRI